jgi:homoserine dehydrogenase
MYNSSLKYKIIAFNETTGQIVVKPENMSPLCVDLPIQNNKYLEGLELDNYIRTFIPTGVSERPKLIEKVTNKDAIAALVEVEKLPREQQLYNIRYNRNNLLYNTDWILAVPDSNITNEVKEAIKVYRQELRDITKQDIYNIKWPVNPIPLNMR